MMAAVKDAARLAKIDLQADPLTDEGPELSAAAKVVERAYQRFLDRLGREHPVVARVVEQAIEILWEWIEDDVADRPARPSKPPEPSTWWKPWTWRGRGSGPFGG